VDSNTGWTLDTLYTHFATVLREQDERYREALAATDLRNQQRYDAQTKALDAAFLAAEKAVDRALSAAEKAVSKAEAAAEKRFESVNEFRGTLSDQASQFITRTEAEVTFRRDAERIQELTDRVNRTEGHGAGLSAGWGYLVAAVGLAATVVIVILAFNN
jgi:hypothetical protein